MSKRKVNRYKAQDEEELQDELLKIKENPPRFFKNNIDGINLNEVVVNLSKTHYDVIQQVVQQLGWVVQTSKKSEKWDIMWTDWHIEAHDLFRLNDHQKISHFPAIYVLAKKNFLGKGLMKMNKIFPLQYNFFPFTWSIPSQMGQFLRYDSQTKQQKNPVYIFKPQASCQGKGIVLFTKAQQIQGKTGIAQVYLDNPLLIDNLKFDMRIYVLIYGCDPMRIYIYEEGLARFATSNYEKAKKKNLKDNFVHLTNYAINKNNKKFIFNTSQKNMNVGHKRSLTSIYSLLKAKGVDVDTLKQKIDKLIVKTLLVGSPMLQHMYGLSQTDNLANDHCFQILGLDVILNQFLEPILLQVNHTPSFATDTPLDKNIKKNLIKETLLLLNVNLQTKNARIQKMKQFGQKRFQRKLIKLSAEQKGELKRQIQKEKDEYEQKVLKKYRKIYPLLNRDQYKSFEQNAMKFFNQQQGMKNKQSIQKNSNKKPTSFQNFQSPNKVKYPKYNKQQSSILKLQNSMRYLLQKLPAISSKKAKILQSQSVQLEVQNKIMIKCYDFNPEVIFSQLTDKIYAQNVRLKQKQEEGTPIVWNKQKKDKREGSFLQIKNLKLCQLVHKKTNFADFFAATDLKRIQKNDKKMSRMNRINLQSSTKIIQSTRQNQIISQKQQQKQLSSIKKQIKKIQDNKFKDFSRYSYFLNTSDQIFPIKSMSLYKKKIDQ